MSLSIKEVKRLAKNQELITDLPELEEHLGQMIASLKIIIHRKLYYDDSKIGERLEDDLLFLEGFWQEIVNKMFDEPK